MSTMVRPLAWRSSRRSSTSAAGGVFGLLIGYAGSGVLGQAFPALPARPPAWAVFAALTVSLLSGALFGVLPARRAARLDPVIALAGR